MSAREPARDPRLRRAEGLLGTVEDRLRALAARERQLRALGLGARVPRLRAARDPLEELLPALQEAVSIHGTDPALAARLLQDAEDRWGRMQNLLLSVDAWDPTGEARARDVQAASEEHTRAQQRLRDAGARWKAARSKLRDRALQKRFDQELKALQKQGAALSKEVAKAKDLRPWTARSTQLLVDAGGFLRAVDAAFEPPPPPPPSPPELVVPEVEPEPIPVVEPAVEPEPEPEPAP
ncbi:MAG: hypothetical protein FJ098_06065 [Deltaproteobacteria bacterium]|nr:hypothetical protein [Deltaproteobacteria bacterium]